MTVHQTETYILVARICKNDDRETLEYRNKSPPSNHPYWPSIGHSITLGKMIDYKNDKIPNGYQRYDACIFQGVQTAKEGKRDYNKPSVY
jgi:hypothetical protein